MNTNCILKSIGEVLERDRSSVNGDFLPVRVSQAAHALGVVREVEFCALDTILVVQPFGGVADALLARVLDGL